MAAAKRYSLPRLRQRGAALSWAAALLLAACDDGLAPPDWDPAELDAAPTIEIESNDVAATAPAADDSAAAPAVESTPDEPAVHAPVAVESEVTAPAPAVAMPIPTARLAAAVPAAAPTVVVQPSRSVVTEAAPAAATPLAPRVYQTQPIRGPRVGNAERTHDFGTVVIGDEVRHSFVMHNAGDRSMRILRATPTLGLARVKFDRDIEPGADGKLEIALPTARMKAGRVMISVVLETTDRRSDVSFLLTGTLELPGAQSR